MHVTAYVFVKHFILKIYKAKELSCLFKCVRFRISYHGEISPRWRIEQTIPELLMRI